MSTYLKTSVGQFGDGIEPPSSNPLAISKPLVVTDTWDGIWTEADDEAEEIERLTYVREEHEFLLRAHIEALQRNLPARLAREKAESRAKSREWFFDHLHDDED